jgi:hypothetical protein
MDRPQQKKSIKREHFFNMNKICHFRSIFPAVLFITLLFAVPSFAGVLKIQTGTTVQATEGPGQDITVRLINRGTAVAHNVQVHLKLLGATLDSKVEPGLEPGQSRTFSFEKNIEGVKKDDIP